MKGYHDYITIYTDSGAFILLFVYIKSILILNFLLMKPQSISLMKIISSTVV